MVGLMDKKNLMIQNPGFKNSHPEDPKVYGQKKIGSILHALRNQE
jgi:hypothetical protein